MTSSNSPTAPSTQLRELQAFGEAFQYDVRYLEELLEDCPDGFAAFEGARELSAYRQHLSLDAHFVARVATMQAEDCGACAQLNLRMAVEAGVERGLLMQALQDPSALPGQLPDVYSHALDVASGAAIDLDRVHRLRAGLGSEAFAELALTIAGSRIFPSLKRALGHSGACEQLHLNF